MAPPMMAPAAKPAAGPPHQPWPPHPPRHATVCTAEPAAFCNASGAPRGAAPAEPANHGAVAASTATARAFEGRFMRILPFSVPAPRLQLVGRGAEASDIKATGLVTARSQVPFRAGPHNAV